jgi:hyperosmotically inducible periplasmic protein
MTRQKLFGWLGALAVAMTTVACSQSDPGITAAVKSKLAADDTVKSYRIDVDTKDRIVTLKGEVDTEVNRARALQIARTTDGVRDVVDSMTVAPGATPTTGVDDPLQNKASEASRDARAKAGETGDVMGDAGITTAVKTKMLADPDVAGLKIDVDTKDSIVTLTGNVTSTAEKKKAIELAKETSGVKSVIDRLKIEKK